MTVLSIFLQAATGSGMSSILMMVALIAIFYFFMIRPQTKRQKEIRKFRDSLTTGDKIVTAGGLLGKIKEVKSDYFIIEIADKILRRIYGKVKGVVLSLGNICGINEGRSKPCSGFFG
mgnify:CR=1 FL=1